MHELNALTDEAPTDSGSEASGIREIQNRMKIDLRDIGIPPRPSILLQIEEESRRDEPDFIRLAKIINADVALAAGLIKTANSPFFGYAKRARTAQEALLVLGIRFAVNTISGLALQQIFKHAPHMERFWDASATTARVAGWLAQQLKGRAGSRPEDAYTFALFRDCGIPVLIIPFPEYLAALNRANDEQILPFTEIERQALGIDHAEVGASLAESWLLPDELCRAIRQHHDRAALEGNGAALSQRSRTLIAFAQLAEYLIQNHTGRAQTHEWEKLGPATLAVLQIGEEELAALAEAAQETITGS